MKQRITGFLRATAGQLAAQGVVCGLMIRVAISGLNAAAVGEIAPRLRGALLEAFSGGSLPACDAAVFFGPQVDGMAIEQFLKSGKHVLLSAAASLPGEQLPALSAAARQSGVQFVVANPGRNLPSRQLIRQQLDAGKLGEPGLVRLHRWEPEASPQALPLDLDLVFWLFGKPPNRVYATGDLQVHLGFPGGGMALLDHANRLPPGDGYHSLSVIGSAGAAHADDHNNMQLLYLGGRPQAVRAEEGVLQLSALVQEFADALSAGRDLLHHLTAWRNALAVEAAVRKSLRTRQAIEPEGLQ